MRTFKRASLSSIVFLCFSPMLSATEIVDCKNLNESQLNSQAELSCSTFSETRLESRGAESRVLSPNGLPTSILFHNKGGYVAWMKVEYYTPNVDGTYTHHYKRTSTISAPLFTEVKLPKDAERVRVHAQLNTSAFWQPIRDIFIFEPVASDNAWTRNKEGYEVENIMQFDVWGTTFNSAYAIVQPQLTEKNNNKLKSWATPGQPGDLYVYENPYSKKVEVFKLKGNQKEFFPTNGGSNNDWEYVNLKHWGESGRNGDLYIYDNPYSRTTDIFQLKGSHSAYFPTNGVSSKDWIALGQYK